VEPLLEFPSQLVPLQEEGTEAEGWSCGTLEASTGSTYLPTDAQRGAHRFFISHASRGAKGAKKFCSGRHVTKQQWCPYAIVWAILDDGPCWAAMENYKLNTAVRTQPWRRELGGLWLSKMFLQSENHSWPAEHLHGRPCCMRWPSVQCLVSTFPWNWLRG